MKSPKNLSHGFVLLVLAAAILSCLTQPNTAFAEGEVFWQHTYGGPSNDAGGALNISAAGNGNLLLVTGTQSYGMGGGDMWVLMVDSTGNVIWDTTYGGTDDDYASVIIPTGDGNFLLGGRTKSYGAGGYDWYVLKINPTGNVIWSHTYGGPVDDGLNAMVACGDGNFILAGSTGQYPCTAIKLLKIDSEGTALDSLTDNHAYEDIASSIIPAGDGGYLVAGSSDPWGNVPDRGYLLKVDANLDYMWSRYYGTSSSDGFYCIIPKGDGNFLAAGLTKINGNYNMWLFCVSMNGDSIWSKNYGGPGTEDCTSLIAIGDGGFLLIGSTSSKGAGSYDHWLVRVDDEGTLMWDSTYGGPSEDCGGKLVASGDGNFFTFGYTCSIGAGSRDLWLLKVNGPEPIVGEIAGAISPAFTDFQITLKDNGGNLLASTTTQNGNYTFADQAPGSYLVELNVPFGYAADQNPRPVTVISGQTATVNFALTELPGTVSGTLTPPLPGIIVDLINNQGQVVATETTEANGQFAFDNVPAGSYTVQPHSTSEYTSGPPQPVSIGPGGNGTANPSMIPIPGIISGIVVPAMANLIVTLSDANAAPITTVATDGNGVYAFPNLNQGDYYVDLALPAGYASDQNHILTHVGWGASIQVDFQMTILPGVIEGHVTPALAGITIGVTGANQFYAYDLTDEMGFYRIEGLAGNCDYTAEQVIPLGFLCNSENPVTRYLTGGTTQTIDFTIAAVVTTNTARGKGYWKHQANANGNLDYAPAQLLEMTQSIFDHFYCNPVNPIQIAGVTYEGDPVHALTVADLQYRLNLQGNYGMYQKACQQFLTLLLNLASNKVGQYTLASAEGVNHSQAVVYIADLLTEPGTNYELAKNIAETLNSAQLVANGVIPVNTPVIIFGSDEEALTSKFLTFEVNQPAPNPFNPTITFSFTLPEAQRVGLNVYDMQGRLVDILVNGLRPAGEYRVIFDGSNLPSGMYLYTLTAGTHMATGKMVLLK